MAVWYAISDEWIFLLNPALWLLFLHPAILYVILHRIIKDIVPLILIICILSPFLSWFFSILHLSFEDMILEHLINRGAGEYLPYYHSDGPSNIVTALFGWAWSFILVPFWLIVLLLASLISKDIKRLYNKGVKIADDGIGHTC
ncbi:MAG TPA: hypothetical protein DIU00_08375 [Phycisphaerales bacterium]|nr:hypothetical protein [Phycisphaerales bacterium]